MPRPAKFLSNPSAYEPQPQPQVPQPLEVTPVEVKEEVKKVTAAPKGKKTPAAAPAPTSTKTLE